MRNIRTGDLGCGRERGFVAIPPPFRSVIDLLSSLVAASLRVASHWHKSVFHVCFPFGPLDSFITVNIIRSIYFFAVVLLDQFAHVL